MAEEKGGDVHEIIAELRQVRAMVVLILRQDFQAQQARNRAPTLRPGTGVNLGIPIINENDLAFLEIKAVRLRPVLHAELVPEAAADGDPRTLPQLLDFGAVLGRFIAKHDVLGQLRVLTVNAPFVGEHPGYFGGGGGFDQFALLLRWRGDAHRDDEDLLALKCLDQALLVVVVDFRNFHAGWWSAGTPGAGDGRDGMLAGL